MGKQLSLDIRERVVWLVEQEGLSRREAARRVMISVSSAIRIMDQKRRTGSVALAAEMGRPRHSKLDAVNDWLRGKIAAQPDLTMPELSEDLLAAHGITATPAMLSRHLIHRLGLTHKKRR